MAAKKRSTMDLFDAQLEMESLGCLFGYIKTQLHNAEDQAGHTPTAEPYHQAIEALAEQGMRRCQEAMARICATRKTQRAS